MRARRAFVRPALTGRRVAAALAFAAASATSLPALAAVTLPALPEAIKAKGVLNAGVRCDQPPYGYQDEKGGYAGVETDMARQIAKWAFGDETKIAFTCVTAENRIPQLTAGRVDLLIATLGATPERARVIDFTKPYRWGASGVLVKADSPYQKVADLDGQTVVTPKGSVQAKWFEDKMPKVTTLRLNGTADSLQAFKQGRAVAYAHDGATLVVIADQDKSMRVLDDAFLISDAAIGVRKNEEGWRDYLTASIAKMQDEKLFRGLLAKWVPEGIRPYYVNVFENPPPPNK